MLRKKVTKVPKSDKTVAKNIAKHISAHHTRFFITSLTPLAFLLHSSNYIILSFWKCKYFKNIDFSILSDFWDLLNLLLFVTRFSSFSGFFIYLSLSLCIYFCSKTHYPPQNFQHLEIESKIRQN